MIRKHSNKSHSLFSLRLKVLSTFQTVWAKSAARSDREISLSHWRILFWRTMRKATMLAWQPAAKRRVSLEFRVRFLFNDKNKPSLFWPLFWRFLWLFAPFLFQLDVLYAPTVRKILSTDVYKAILVLELQQIVHTAKTRRARTYALANSLCHCLLFFFQSFRTRSLSCTRLFSTLSCTLRFLFFALLEHFDACLCRLFTLTHIQMHDSRRMIRANDRQRASSDHFFDVDGRGVETLLQEMENTS